MENLYFYVGIIGNIISVFVFLAPVEIFRRIMKNKSTEEFDCLPYICTLLSSSLWTYYGVTKPGSYLVATVNGFGAIVEILYISLFLIYASPRVRGKTGIMVGTIDVGFLAATIAVTSLAMEGEMKINTIGFMCAGFNIIMYASPLVVMKTVVRTKSVEYMPFLLSFFLFLNGAVWTFYAFLVEDWFLAVSPSLSLSLYISVYVSVLLFISQLSRLAMSMSNKAYNIESPNLQELPNPFISTLYTLL